MARWYKVQKLEHSAKPAQYARKGANGTVHLTTGRVFFMLPEEEARKQYKIVGVEENPYTQENLSSLWDFYMGIE